MRVHGAQPPLRSLRTGGSTASGAANGNIRRAVLCTLAVQNACQMLSMRYSRMPGQPKYLTSTAVVTAEATKIAAAFLIMLYQHRGRAFAEVWQGVIVDWRDTMLVGVPAFLYLIQNNLLYVATTHLDAATCQVAYQLKLLTTAFFSVTMMKRHISLRRWLALGILFIGIVLVQSPQVAQEASGSHSAVIGMAAVVSACLLSGLAGVWLERIVKRTSEVSIWLRSIQLGFVSLVLGIGSVAVLDREAVLQGGFFQGYTWFTCFVVLQVSLGGMLVALVMKYADNVVKGFATSLSIVLSSAVSWFIPSFEFAPTAMFSTGSSLVIVATVLYSSSDRRARAGPPLLPVSSGAKKSEEDAV